MKVKQDFTIHKPREQVWESFQDIPLLAECMPGAALTEDKGAGRYLGKITTRLGPFKASFDGEVVHTPDPAAYKGHAEGKGIDRRGGSRSKLEMDYALDDLGKSTRVEIDADIQLSGPVAQFGRTAIVEETAKLLISQFVENLEKRIGNSSEKEPDHDDAPATESAARRKTSGNADIGIISIIRSLISERMKRLFGRG